MHVTISRARETIATLVTTSIFGLLNEKVAVTATRQLSFEALHDERLLQLTAV
jgi:hypothetical protein